MRSLEPFLYFLIFFNKKISHTQKAQKTEKAQKAQKKHKNANKRMSNFFPLRCFLSA